MKGWWTTLHYCQGCFRVSIGRGRCLPWSQLWPTLSPERFQPVILLQFFIINLMMMMLLLLNQTCLLQHPFHLLMLLPPLLSREVDNMIHIHHPSHIHLHHSLLCQQVSTIFNSLQSCSIFLSFSPMIIKQSMFEIY